MSKVYNQLFKLTAPVIEQTDEENKKRAKQKTFSSLFVLNSPITSYFAF